MSLANMPRAPGHGGRAVTAAAIDLDNMHEDACPDCDAPPGRSCHWWCPRYADVLYDEEIPDEV